MLLVAILAAQVIADLAPVPDPLHRVSIVLVAGAVVFIAAQHGRAAALAAGLVGGAYALFYFVRFGEGEPLAESLTLGGAIAGTLLGLGLVVGTLRTRADEANERALRAERARSLELMAANRDLAALNEGLQSFAYVVSHDLKEPVRATAAYLDEALESAQKPQTRAAVEAARVSNERLSTLLLGVLEVARASRLDPAELRPIDPLETLASPSCATRYSTVLRERGAKLTTSAAPGTPRVLATQEHLAQALGNLVVNAARHSGKPAPTIEVRVAPSASGPKLVDIVVEDDGAGFPARAADSFGRVSHLGSALPRGGFGLLIVRRAVERLHGTMRLERGARLGGACVRITLPAAA